MPRAFSLAALPLEESGKAAEIAILAVLPPALRARMPLRRLLEWHQLKLAGGLLLTALPLGNAGPVLAAMPAGELARRMRVFAPADFSDLLKRTGF